MAPTLFAHVGSISLSLSLSRFLNPCGDVVKESTTPVVLAGLRSKNSLSKSEPARVVHETLDMNSRVQMMKAENHCKFARHDLLMASHQKWLPCFLHDSWLANSAHNSWATTSPGCLRPCRHAALFLWLGFRVMCPHRTAL